MSLNPRRGSRFTSDDLDDLALMQQHESAAANAHGKGLSLAGLVHVLPLRPHGLCVAVVAAAASAVVAAASAVLLVRNALLDERARLPLKCVTEEVRSKV